MVYAHIAQGRLKAHRIGGRKGYRVSEEQLEHFLRLTETRGALPEVVKHLRL
jgi:hypothetical protein